MPTSTYPKEWKNMFIFVSASLLLESPPLRDPKAVIDDSVPTLSAKEIVLWKRMHEYPTRAFNFPEGILAVGGLSPLYPILPKAYCEKKGQPFVLEGKTPDLRSSAAVGEVEKAPSTKEGSSERTEVSQNSPIVKNISSEKHKNLASRLSRKRKAGSEAGSKVVVPNPQNIRLRLRRDSGQKSLPAYRATSEVPPTKTKGSLSKHLKTLRPSSSLVSEPLLVSSS
ncbi:hypothetical protein HanRHA438_Chr09g0419931 [Helianthus annuus]|nr:hypothetical protein HanOQP8_Chr09g0339571 [Helianthus annuus]KAJ0890094.1 hypothetical protein HanRHA438_Chr09g0419931 [Helianthus annuus]KAJ0894863.1 hypothetical protein HanPSC8_Chr09g0393751 [Helianthus annuus]